MRGVRLGRGGDGGGLAAGAACTSSQYSRSASLARCRSSRSARGAALARSAPIAALPAGVGGVPLPRRARDDELPAAAAAGHRLRVLPAALGELEASGIAGSSRPAGAADTGVVVKRHGAGYYRRHRADQRPVGTIPGVTGLVPRKFGDDPPEPLVRLKNRDRGVGGSSSAPSPGCTTSAGCASAGSATPISTTPS